MPLLGQNPEVAKYCSEFMSKLEQRPRAVVMVSAHWEGSKVMINNGARPGLLFDYGGFPKETYQY